ncbi:glycosyltransferase [Buttiauxella sp.]|uniref:glycosyltransferase n=1 Tax=Buttiauxella sp. TaxID=1972222 RepID=UPI003C71D22F
MAYPALVSIIIPAYKSMWFEQTLTSSIAQDYPLCEIIVSDDCPNESIGEIVRRYQDNSPHTIRYFRNQPALGDVGNYERCFRESQGKYIKLFSDDDVLEPTCISKLVAAIEAHDDVRIATSRRQRIDASGDTAPDILATASPVAQASILHGRDIIAFQTRQVINFIGEPCTVLMYRDDILALMATEDGLFSVKGEVMHFLEDLTMFTHVFRNAHLAYLPEVLSYFRISRNQKSELGRSLDPRAEKSRLAYIEYAKQLTQEEQGSTSGLVRVAPLNQPLEFVQKDILVRMQDELIQNQFRNWLGVRKLLDSERRLTEAWVETFEKNVEVTVIVDNAGAALSAADVTVNSLKGDFPGLDLSVIVTDEGIGGFNHAVEQATGEWVLVVRAGATFYPSALLSLGTTLSQADSLLAVYCDETFSLEGLQIGARFRPDFNLDLLLSSPAVMARHWLWRRELLLAAQGFDAAFPEAYELDLALKVVETQGFSPIGHLGEPLLNAEICKQRSPDEVVAITQHLVRRGFTNAEVLNTTHDSYRIDYRHGQLPLVSLLILADGDFPAMITCVTSLIEKTSWLNYELIVVADNTQSPQALDWLESICQVDPERIHVVGYTGPYHIAAMTNLGAQQARGEYMVTLHTSLAVTEGNWLDQLMNHGLRPEAGIVGGKQLYADGTIRHAGYVLGVNGVAADAFYGLNDSHKGHMGRLHADQNYSAVSGEFMLVRKSLFTECNGMDENLTSLSDVDFCLRAKELGYLTVWTPHARILRTLGKKQETVAQRDRRLALQEEDEDRLFGRWMPQIANDTAYNVNLSLSGQQFNVCPDSLLSWRPLSWQPLPVVMPHMGDYAGCGYYRIIKPFEAMQRDAIVDGKLSEALLSVPYLARYQPDSIVIQRNISPDFHEWARRTSKLTNVFRVYELDDYLPNIPLKNHHRSEFGTDIMKMLRKSLSYMDRFVVSTEPLAEAMSVLHRDIVVMPNCLSLDWWGNLQGLRNQGKKPRIGWAGGSSHTGDLEMILDVVKAFAGEVEWVFFGMCPPKLLPYVDEFHGGVDIALYPQKLASLNLDLALAPVEDNLFNACKSNLRLLEYGACAVPVICSDVACYRGNLPVTRVRNRFKEWHDAIRMHLNDPAASEKMGQQLQQEIHQNYMLQGDILQRWAKAWLPS